MLPRIHSILGFGDMGFQLAEVLKANGITDILYYHPREDIEVPSFLEGRERSLEHAISGSDVRWHCYPLGLMSSLIESTQAFPRREGTIDIEIASVKTPQQETMAKIRAKNGFIIQSHPMHKHMSIDDLAGERTFITSPNEDYFNDPDIVKAREVIAPLFAKVGEKVLYTTNEEHDRYTAAVQGLRMVAILALAYSLGGAYIKTGTRGMHDKIPLPMPGYDIATHNLEILQSNIF